jgi:hypothetical protein
MPKRRNARTSERDAITAPHALIETRTINPRWHSIALFHVPWRSHQARDERLLLGASSRGGEVNSEAENGKEIENIEHLIQCCP